MGENSKLRPKLTYANVMVTILAFIVLGGGAAFAALGANTVGTGQLKRNAVTVGKIAPEAVRAGKLAKNAIATNRLRNGAVNQQKIATDSIGESQLKEIVTRHSPAVPSPGALSAWSAGVQCANGEQPIAAGAELTSPALGWLTSVTVEGGGASAEAFQVFGGADSLIVTAYCLQE